MDYFIPSMMIVAMSWVTFWLQADASAPRITLGKNKLNIGNNNFIDFIYIVTTIEKFLNTYNDNSLSSVVKKIPYKMRLFLTVDYIVRVQL